MLRHFSKFSHIFSSLCFFAAIMGDVGKSFACSECRLFFKNYKGLIYHQQRSFIHKNPKKSADNNLNKNDKISSLIPWYENFENITTKLQKIEPSKPQFVDIDLIERSESDYYYDGLSSNRRRVVKRSLIIWE